MDLRPYQVEAIERARQAIKAGARNILIVAPTGAGKTVIGAHILDQAAIKHKHAQFFAHRREIIHQTSEKLHDFGCMHGILMAGHRPSAMSRVQVTSVQTFHARVIRGKKPAPLSHILMFDEAHRSVSPGYEKIRSMYPDAILIGLTATPVRGDGRGLGSMYDQMIEVETVQGLVDQGYLVPTRIFAPTIPDLTGVRTRGGDYVEEDLEEVLDRQAIIGDVVKHWHDLAKGRPTVVFCSGVRHSLHVAEQLTKAGAKAAHIDGKTDKHVRDRILGDLAKGQLDIVSNCNVLTEGWDCPRVSCAILLRPTKSYGLYLQMAGRILRPNHGKNDALIIDHSGAVYRHGRPEDAGGWSLEEDEPIEERRQRQREEELRDLTCRNCWTVYRGRHDCPNCGWVPTKQSKKLDIQEGRLVEVKPKKSRMDDKRKIWRDCLWRARYVNLKVGAAAHMYRKKTGVWPRGMHELQPNGNEWQMKAKDFLSNRTSDLLEGS